MSRLKRKILKNTQEWSPKEPFGDVIPNLDICGPVFKELFRDIDVTDVDAKTKTAASSENSGWKSTENE